MKINKDVNPILTAKVGNNADLFPDVLKLYVPEGLRVLDMTYGKGVFWKNVDVQTKFKNVFWNDIDPDRGYYHYDFTDLPEDWADKFDAVILDPPYMYHSSTTHKESIDKGYANNERVRQGIHGIDAVHDMFRKGMTEGKRVLRRGGVLVVKCMDQIMSGKQHRQHIALWHIATQELNLLDEDLFVLVQKGIPTMRWPYQLHARKNNSFFWVFRKKK